MTIFLTTLGLWNGGNVPTAANKIPFAYAMFRFQVGLTQFPTREIARLATEEWHIVFDTPLRIVAASHER